MKNTLTDEKDTIMYCQKDLSKMLYYRVCQILLRGGVVICY